MVNRIDAQRPIARKLIRPLLFLAFVVVGLYLGSAIGLFIAGVSFGLFASLIINDIFAWISANQPQETTESELFGLK